MNVQASAPTYNIHYIAEEDRLLISIDVPPDREFAMSLTRRLAKHLVGTLAAVHAKQREAATPRQPDGPRHRPGLRAPSRGQRRRGRRRCAQEYAGQGADRGAAAGAIGEDHAAAGRQRGAGVRRRRETADARSHGAAPSPLHGGDPRHRRHGGMGPAAIGGLARRQLAGHTGQAAPKALH